MKRILLIIPSSSYRTRAFMSAAFQVGVEVVVASDHRQALAALVPDTTLALNFQQPRQVAGKVRGLAGSKPFDAVIGVDDRSAWIAALAAQALGLPHNPPDALQAARNKLLMRRKLAAAGLNSPGFAVFPATKSPQKVADRVKFPCVLKPIFLSASRGVSRADTPDEFAAHFEFLTSLLRDPEVRSLAQNSEARKVLVEDYIPGVEVAVEAILTAGQFKALAIFDKPDPLEGPHFVETIYLTPSRLPGYVQREVLETARRSAQALGLQSGPIHAEIRLNENGAWPVEIAARSIGGRCSQVLHFQPEMTLEELILRQAIGEDISHVQREKAAAGVMMIPIPAAGILEGVDGVAEARAIDGVEDLHITIPPGQRVEPMPRGGRYLGFIFARGASPEEVESTLRAAHRRLNIAIQAQAPTGVTVTPNNATKEEGGVQRPGGSDKLSY